MMAAQEAGLTLEAFGDLDAYEADLWKRYVLEGPSRFREQMILATLTRFVSVYCMKKPVKIEDLIPYLATLQGKPSRTSRERVVAEQIDQSKEWAIEALRERIDAAQREANVDGIQGSSG